MLPNYEEGYLAGEKDYQSILIPTLSFGPLKIAQKVDLGTCRKLFKGEVLTLKATTPDDPYFFYVEQGQMCLYNQRETGENAVIFWRNEGDAFSTEYGGFASIGKYPARFMATKNSVLYGFSQRQLLEFSKEDPGYFYEFVRVCHMAFAQMGHRVANTSGQAPGMRLAMWLQKLCATSAPNPDGSFSIPCNMTVRQIAELLMVHEATCTKLFSEFERKGIAWRGKGVIHVDDVRLIEKYVEEKTL